MAAENTYQLNLTTGSDGIPVLRTTGDPTLPSSFAVRDPDGNVLAVYTAQPTAPATELSLDYFSHMYLPKDPSITNQVLSPQQS
ncbi:hypothetical protein ACIQM4_27650 [Streptomyces sp. NPDC091272]|uniref:hypothetical protein n=1 Tax=Streptomyces sp. NPDC091272 TaxID=3365981 RepID=UPI00380CBEA0